tara:strand:+ start:3732 stop:4529 length:798 start_codon:yes stop_codon:yes gene_type:complete
MADRKTVTYDEANGGWTSFHSYTPEWMTRLGTQFYTFYQGELYLHESGGRTSFYGSTDGCDITFNVNQDPSDNKIFKNIVLEGTASFETTVNTNMESGTIEEDEYESKEGFRYGYIRQEGSRLFNSELSVIGVGPLQEIIDDASPSNTEFRFSEDVDSNILSSGTDYLYFNDGNFSRFVGIINDITGHPDYGNSRDVIHIVETPNEENNPPSFLPSTGSFCFVSKDTSAESRGIRGYYMRVKLVSDSGGYVELFSVGTEAVKSFM